MPELPEVESLRLSLQPYILQKTIQKIEIRNAKLVSGNGTIRKADELKKQEFIDQLVGETIVEIKRRAKNMIIYFASGKLLLVHLKMTGQLVYRQDSTEVFGGHPIQNLDLPGKHTHIIFTLDKGVLYYNDIRQFGYILFFPNQEGLDIKDHFKSIGPEPFDDSFTLPYFSQKLKTKSSKLKVVLLEQSIVTGLGNIYCDEVCFFAGVMPMRSAKTLTNKEIEKLFIGIKKILTDAIALGGSSIANYLLADGSRGNYARQHKVYGRAGKPCLVCNTPLESMKLGGRTTVYCKVCQK